jgi:uncharacterized protein
MDFTNILAVFQHSGAISDAAGLAFTGAIVGLAIGLTGVGGGSLMTPALLQIFHIPPAIAVGTDLAFAAITKTVGVVAHRKTESVQWRVAGLMLAGSLPTCLIALMSMQSKPSVELNSLIRSCLGVALLGTALSIIFRHRLPKLHIERKQVRVILTLLSGSFIGWMVAWSSIGAGAIGCTVLALIYPELSPQKVAATDIAYAVPLTAVGAIGHAAIGNIDIVLLCSLLVGSVPAIWLGVRLSERLNQSVSRGLLASLLLITAAKSVFF